MAAYVFAFLIAIQVLVPTWALQVTPNSKCASICMDVAGQDPSDPNVSNTYGSDIVCNDADYSSTALGRKFENCINCLQNSSATSTEETDQSWFLYNIRFAFNTCLFNSTNATDAVSTPCVLSSVCSPLEVATTDSMSPSIYSVPLEYSYCSADGAIFAGQYFTACQQCLRENDNIFYLSNFLTALEAGCAQQPANGTLIGLNGTLFSDYQVQIVAPVTAAALAAKNAHKILDRGAITGIAVGGAAALLILAAFLLICLKKRRNKARLDALRSPLNARFGATNITAPHSGAWASQVSPPMTGMYKPPEIESIQMQKAPVVRNFSFSRPRRETPQVQRSREPSPVSDMEDKYTYSHEMTPPIVQSPDPPRYTPPEQYRESLLPTHHAYIPPHYVPPSRQSMSPNSDNTINSSRELTPRAQPLCSNPPLPGMGFPAPHPQRFTPPPNSLSNNNNNTSNASSTPPRHPPVPQVPALLNRASSTTNTNTNPNTNKNTNTLHPHPHLSLQHQTQTQTRQRQRERDISPVVGLQISAPLMRISPRFESDEDARRARERLYREGFAAPGTGASNHTQQRWGNGGEGLSPAEKDKGSPQSAVSEEMWPGTF